MTATPRLAIAGVVAVLVLTVMTVFVVVRSVDLAAHTVRPTPAQSSSSTRTSQSTRTVLSTEDRPTSILPPVELKCGLLFDQDPLPPDPSLPPDTAKIGSTAAEVMRQAGLTAKPAQGGYPKPPTRNTALYKYDVDDSGGRGGVSINVTRYIAPAEIVPQTAARTATCAKYWFWQLRVQQLPNSATAVLKDKDCDLRCGPVVYGVNGLRVEVDVLLHGFPTGVTMPYPPQTRSTPPLSPEQQLQLAAAVAAVG